MADLSISKAWEETKGDMRRDGRLFASIAIALIGLPSIATTLISPEGLGADGSKPLWVEAMALILMLVAVTGQLSLARLALKPPMTVGEALSHGVRRMPAYLAAALLMALGFIALALPFVLAASVFGIKLDTGMTDVTAGEWIVAMLLIIVVCGIAVRMILSAPVAVAEHVGPVQIIKRSWQLTEGHWLRLIGFLLAFLVAAAILLSVIGLAVGSIVRLSLGAVEPLSASALVIGIVQGLFNAAFSSLFAVMLARIYVQLSGHDSAEPA